MAGAKEVCGEEGGAGGVFLRGDAECVCLTSVGRESCLLSAAH